MPLHSVHQVRTRAEFDAVLSCQWAGFSGQDPFWDVWFPTDKGRHLGRPALDAAGALVESRERMWKEHVEDPCSNWFYIRDDGRSGTDGGDGGDAGDVPFVVGSCQWRVYEADPFADGVPELRCPAWPAGSVGDALTALVAEQVYRPRTVLMAKPHVGLGWMAVRPEYRQQGVGKALMQWGIRRADEMGVEAFIEASDMGKFLYLSCGFEVIEEVVIKIPERDDTEWEALVKTYKLRDNFSFTTMKRTPKGR